jgi:hypothetical protein
MGKTLTKSFNFEHSTLDIIRNMNWTETINGTVGITTAGQLDRKTYLTVNEALELLGGKWNKKLKGHLFDINPLPKIINLMDTGTIIKEKDGFFRTPRNITIQMLDMLENIPQVILEPSAGDGAICDVLNENHYEVHAIERNQERQGILKNKGYNVLDYTDFMEFNVANIYKTIVMNPPCEQLQDIDHISHAFNLLAQNGELVSVISESPFFRDTEKAINFRSLVDTYGYSMQLPENSFKESGTGVNTRLVYLKKQ